MQNQPVETVIIDGVSQPFENRFPSLDDRQIARLMPRGRVRSLSSGEVVIDPASGHQEVFRCASRKSRLEPGG
jgi:hypothetical protein